MPESKLVPAHLIPRCRRRWTKVKRHVNKADLHVQEGHDVNLRCLCLYTNWKCYGQQNSCGEKSEKEHIWAKRGFQVGSNIENLGSMYQLYKSGIYCIVRLTCRHVDYARWAWCVGISQNCSSSWSQLDCINSVAAGRYAIYALRHRICYRSGFYDGVILGRRITMLVNGSCHHQIFLFWPTSSR